MRGGGGEREERKEREAEEIGVEEEVDGEVEEGVKREREGGKGRGGGCRRYGRREEETKEVVREDEKERVTRVERW